MADPPLGFGFPLMSDQSARPPHAVPPAEQLAEIDAELAYRRTLYGRQVDRNRMQPDDALQRIETIEAIRDDLMFAYDRLTETWPGQRIDWHTKVRELRRELAIRRGSWPKRVASPADPLDKAEAALRMERLDAVHYRYWMELFGADTLFTGDRQHKFDQLRAWHYVRWLWMRGALKRGGRDVLCVPPHFVQFADQLHRRDERAVGMWRDYRAAAERHGMAAQVGTTATA